MRGNLDYFGDIHKMKNSLRLEFCIFSCSITFSAPNVKLPKLNFSVFGLYLFNRSYLEQGNYIFTFSKHFCVSNCGVNLISTRKQSLATCKQITVKSSFFNHNSHQECNSKFKFSFPSLIAHLCKRRTYL